MRGRVGVDGKHSRRSGTGLDVLVWGLSWGVVREVLLSDSSRLIEGCDEPLNFGDQLLMSHPGHRLDRDRIRPHAESDDSETVGPVSGSVQPREVVADLPVGSYLLAYTEDLAPDSELYRVHPVRLHRGRVSPFVCASALQNDLDR